MKTKISEGEAVAVMASVASLIGVVRPSLFSSVSHVASVIVSATVFFGHQQYSLIISLSRSVMVLVSMEGLGMVAPALFLSLPRYPFARSRQFLLFDFASPFSRWYLVNSVGNEK